jgi:hypothetical protein
MPVTTPYLDGLLARYSGNDGARRCECPKRIDVSSNDAGTCTQEGHENGPAFWAGPGAVGSSVPAGAGPDELEAFLAFHLDQGGVDRSREARVVQLDREVVAFGVLGGLLPGRAQLDIMWCTT